jgi:HEAT repeats
MKDFDTLNTKPMQQHHSLLTQPGEQVDTPTLINVLREVVVPALLIASETEASQGFNTWLSASQVLKKVCKELKISEPYLDRECNEYLILDLDQIEEEELRIDDLIEVLEDLVIPVLIEFSSLSDLFEYGNGYLYENNSWVRIHAIDALAALGGDQAIEAIFKALHDDNFVVHQTAVLALERIFGPSVLTLLQSLLVKSSKDQSINLCHGILMLQSRYQFYNYELFQAHEAAQKSDRPSNQNRDRPSTTNHFPNVTEVKIFEKVESYHESPPRDPPL